MLAVAKIPLSPDKESAVVVAWIPILAPVFLQVEAFKSWSGVPTVWETALPQIIVVLDMLVDQS